MGLGVAILPMATSQSEVKAGSLAAKPFAEGPVSRPIGLLIRKGKYLDRASAAVLEAFKAAAHLPVTADEG
jgi:DNA-binding transcriptional LysR family regulator